MKRALMAIGMVAVLAACSGCMTANGISRHNERVMFAKVNGNTAILGIDVLALQRGAAGYWAEDKTGFMLRAGTDLLVTIAAVAGTLELYNQYQNKDDNPGRSESKSDEQRGNDSQQGAGGNGDTENRDTTIHQDGSGNTIIINQGNGE